jgi:hypothetical protein
VLLLSLSIWRAVVWLRRRRIGLAVQDGVTTPLSVSAAESGTGPEGEAAETAAEKLASDDVSEADVRTEPGERF